MIQMKFSQVTIGDVVIDGRGHAVEVKFIQHGEDGRVILRELVVFKYDNKVIGWPNDYVEVINRCEVCRQRTLAHTGECLNPSCHGLSEVPDDPEAQLEWVKAARQFKAAALKMSDLWSDLDDRAQAVETPDEYPFNESFDDGPLLSILGWLNEDKLNAMQRRAYHMGDCGACESGQMQRKIPSEPVMVALASDVVRGTVRSSVEGDKAAYSEWIATCDQCGARLIE